MQDIPRKPVKSSQIHSIGYDAKTKTLAVQFKPRGGPSEVGHVYHYADVTPEGHQALLNAPSIYSHFHQRRASTFANFTKVS